MCGASRVVLCHAGRAGRQFTCPVGMALCRGGVVGHTVVGCGYATLAQGWQGMPWVGRQAIAAALGRACAGVGGAGLCSWHRGLPGYFWHLDAFVAHPLWFEFPLPGKVSLVLVLLGLCSLLPPCPRQAEQAAGQPLPVAYVAWLVLWHAVVVSLGVPWTFGQSFAGSWWIVADFFLFWGKVGAMVFFVSPCCIRKLRPWGGACLLVVGLGGTLLWGLM